MQFLLRCCLLGLGLLVIAANSAIAVETENLVGIYTDELMTANTATAEPGDYLTFFVVLDNPHNPFRGGSRGEDVVQVGCYAFGLDLSTNLQFVTKDLPTADKRPECTGDCTYFRDCFGAQLPVESDRHITLRSFVVRYLGPGPAEIRLRPDVFELFDGKMDYWYRDPENTGWVLAMHPVTGSYELPALVINGEGVPTVAQSWGALKALYR
jgi:hypothetical protein